jgi:hypothetical protein
MSFLQQQASAGMMLWFWVSAASSHTALRCTIAWGDSARRQISYMRRMLHFLICGAVAAACALQHTPRCELRSEVIAC